MSGENYGPFAQIVGLAAILVTVFNFLVRRAVGKISQWTFLVHDSPPFMVTAGAQALSLGLIATTFVFINASNYRWFIVGVVVLGVLLAVFVARLDRVRKQHLCKVPELNADGSQARTWWGKEKSKMVVIGDVADMNTTAATAYRKLAASPCKFMSGYGENGVNDPGAIWPLDVLAKNSSRMTMLVMGIIICAVLALFVTAAVIDVHQRLPATVTAPTK